MKSETLPGWARAADLVTAGLVGASLIVAASGGFRTHVGAVSVSMRSPLRLILWAAVVAGVRWTFARQQSVHGHLVSRVGAWTRADAARTAARVAIGTRPATIAVGYLAVALFGYAANARPFHEFNNELLDLPLRWDAGWYLQIAASGYQFLRQAGPDLQQNVVFFPAYPIAVRATALLFGDTMPAYIVAAQCVSFAAFLVALAYLYELAKDSIGEDKAPAALWFLAAYPFAIFYGAIYTESLFLAAAAGSFYHLRRDEVRAAMAWALLAGLTRPNGFLLSVPLALLAFDRRSRRALPAAAMPIVGVAVYSAFVWDLTGSPIAWLTGHAAWERHYQGLGALVVDRYDFIAGAGFQAYASRRPYDLLNAAAAVFALSAVWPVLRRLGLAYAAFIVVNIVPPLMAGGLLSAGRLTSVLFPVFLWLGAAVPDRHRSAWIATFASLQALCAALFYTWRPLY